MEKATGSHHKASSQIVEHSGWHVVYFFKILNFYLFIFRQRGKEGEREGEKHKCVVALVRPLLGTWPATRHVL